MRKGVVYVALLVTILAGITLFNLLVGVFGLDLAIVTLVVFVIFAIYTSLRTQSEEGGPHA
jgi:hypothetical protein